jgi:EAL domain-containing protein (putative c-di-GMP-specific phosphodiesterase class I)
MAEQGHGTRRQDLADMQIADTDPVSYAISQGDKETIAMVRVALETKRLRLAFQPVVLTRTPDKIAFYEGLMRVLDPGGRVIPAREFMGAVEQQDLGRLIDCAALEIGLSMLLRYPDLRLSLNMSARSVGYPRWARTLQRGLRAGQTVGERLILEISEASVNTVPELAAEFMKGLQTEGVTFALDGFGAGLTALKNFRDFYFDIIKIDDQFIRGINTNPDNQMLVRAMVLLARHYDLLTVAQSVETREEADVLRDIGIDAVQGYLFGAPTVRPAFIPVAKQKSA